MARRMTSFTLAGSALALLVSFGASGCHSTPFYDYKSEPDPRASEFKIGPLDLLQVVVWKNKDLSADVVVRPDGIVTLPTHGG